MLIIKVDHGMRAELSSFMHVVKDGNEATGAGLKLQMSFFYISSQHYLQYGPERVFPPFVSLSKMWKVAA